MELKWENRHERGRAGLLSPRTERILRFTRKSRLTHVPQVTANENERES